jgi:3-dehydroquinate dehydratase type II
VERILVLNGPNLNLLGERDPGHYGTATLEELNRDIASLAAELGVEVVFFQSNHEGDLIDRIQDERNSSQGLIINPGALTHYSYAIRDAIEAVGVPAVEVHLSDIRAREEWRRTSVIEPVVWLSVVGKGPGGYMEALRELVAHLRGRST